MRENKVITTREQVIAAAQRQNELAEQQSKKEAKAEVKAEVKAKESPTPSRRIAGVRHANRTPTPSPKGKSGEGKCFNCGKFGHRQNECRAPPKNPTTEDKDKDQSKKWKPKACETQA
jgi:hypothetical protein